jgi:hypothetical protein
MSGSQAGGSGPPPETRPGSSRPDAAVEISLASLVRPEPVARATVPGDPIAPRRKDCASPDPEVRRHQCCRCRQNPCRSEPRDPRPSDGRPSRGRRLGPRSHHRRADMSPISPARRLGSSAGLPMPTSTLTCSSRMSAGWAARTCPSPSDVRMPGGPPRPPPSLARGLFRSSRRSPSSRSWASACDSTPGRDAPVWRPGQTRDQPDADQHERGPDQCRHRSCSGPRGPGAHGPCVLPESAARGTRV